MTDFNRFVAPDLTLHPLGADTETADGAHGALQLDALLARSFPIRDTIVRFEVNHARAKTLDDLWRTDESHAIMARYLGS